MGLEVCTGMCGRAGVGVVVVEGFSDRDQRLLESLERHCGNVGCLGGSHDSSEAHNRGS